VLEQTGPTAGDSRTRGLRWLSGQRKTDTIHSENGCRFAIDLKSVFFTPRLSHERARIANLVASQGKKEVIVNMFAGAGCFSIVILKRAPECLVYSLDTNPQAVRYMIKNIWMNKRTHRIIPMLGDSRSLAERFLASRADRVLLPLPKKSIQYLDTAIGSIKKRGGFVHLYDSVESPTRRSATDRTVDKLRMRTNHSRSFKLRFKRVVRSVGSRRYQVVVDMEILPIAE
jgi:tRNA (guanine37-N1)-methyltransferase